MSYIFFKRILDFLFSILFLFILSPILLIIAFLVLISSSGPILFTQKRMGLNFKLFTIYKFRTMYINAKKGDHQIFIGDSDVTPIGNFLRRYKLDELPQIYNVLLGEMSLVGPRPCLPSTLNGMSDRVKKRFKIKPGLTGLAQINGGILLSWPERWEYDICYVKKCSMILDLKIILRTLFVIIFDEKTFKKKI